MLVYRASHWLRSVNNLRSPRSDDGAFFDSEDEIGKTAMLYLENESKRPGDARLKYNVTGMWDGF